MFLFQSCSSATNCSSSLTHLSQSLDRVLETEDSEDDFVETSQLATRSRTRSSVAARTRPNSSTYSRRASIRALSPITKRLEPAKNAARRVSKTQSAVANPQRSTVSFAATQPPPEGPCTRYAPNIVGCNFTLLLIYNNLSVMAGSRSERQNLEHRNCI